MRQRADVIITGGGTAGHISPALAVAKALCDRGHAPGSILLVGARHGLERELFPPAGYPYVLLPGRGIVRRLTLSNLVALGAMVTAFVRALGMVGWRRPGVVVSVGGYGGVACACAARCWRIPVVTVNVDAVVGMANRLIASFAEISTVAFTGTGLSNAVVTGVPVREEILSVHRDPLSRNDARRRMDVAPGRRVVAVVGGSLGARTLNDAAIGLARRFADRDDLVLYHVTGARDFERYAAMAVPDGALDYRRVRYEAAMADLLGAADVLVARAGAMTVAELRVVGLPAVLVPLPNAPRDHQRRNAEALSEVGAAVVIADADADAETLGATIEALLSDPARLASMEEAGREGARRDAAAHIAGILDDVAERARRTSRRSGA